MDLDLPTYTGELAAQTEAVMALWSAQASDRSAQLRISFEPLSHDSEWTRWKVLLSLGKLFLCWPLRVVFDPKVSVITWAASVGATENAVSVRSQWWRQHSRRWRGVTDDLSPIWRLTGDHEFVSVGQVSQAFVWNDSKLPCPSKNQLPSGRFIRFEISNNSSLRGATFSTCQQLWYQAATKASPAMRWFCRHDTFFCEPTFFKYHLEDPMVL